MKEVSGHLILLMGPTGSGKGTLVNHVKGQFPALQFAVSCTTREKRPTETDGVEYFFISDKSFQEKIENNEFLEWAEFSGNKYGTLKSEIIDRLNSGQVVLNEIELQGIQQLLPIINEKNRTLIYVEAGSWNELRARAIARAPITEEALNLRYERFLEEEKMKPYANVIIHNTEGRLEESKKDFEKIVKNIFEQTN